MIKPVNKHLLIEPLKSESFISGPSETLQEIGVVLDAAPDLHFAVKDQTDIPAIVGQKVYFDAWLAAKYPKNAEGEFYWLVKWEDVRAIEYVIEPVSEQPLPQ